MYKLYWVKHAVNTNDKAQHRNISKCSLPSVVSAAGAAAGRPG